MQLIPDQEMSSQVCFSTAKSTDLSSSKQHSPNLDPRDRLISSQWITDFFRNSQGILKLVLGHSSSSTFHGNAELRNDLLCSCDHRPREFEVLLVDDAEI
jgi:hypothetical protein